MPKKLEDEAMEILPALSEVMSPKRMMKTKVDSFQPAALVADIKSVIRKKGPLTRKHRAKLYMKHKKLLHRDLTGL